MAILEAESFEGGRIPVGLHQFHIHFFEFVGSFYGYFYAPVRSFLVGPELPHINLLCL